MISPFVANFYVQYSIFKILLATSRLDPRNASNHHQFGSRSGVAVIRWMLRSAPSYSSS